jgi:hypothetical protein
MSSSGVESGQKPRKRITSMFKRKERAPRPQAESSTPTSQTNQPNAPVESPDRQRTKARYRAAGKALEKAVKGHESQWGSFDFPELQGELKDFSNSQFKNKIEEVLQARQLPVNRTAWGKCIHALEFVFATFSPLATNILTIANEAQSVSALLLFFHSIDCNFEPLWIAFQRTASAYYGCSPSSPSNDPDCR